MTADVQTAKYRRWGQAGGKKGWRRISQTSDMGAPRLVGGFTLGFCTSVVGCARGRMGSGSAELGVEGCNVGVISPPCIISPKNTSFFLFCFLNAYFRSLAE